MDLPEKVVNDIQTGNGVLFLGAGVGVTVGLNSTDKLAELIFNSIGAPIKYEKYKNNFYDLVARLDDDLSFKRESVDKIISDYFNDKSNYKNLVGIKSILEKKWSSIYTTNYDLSIEFANEESPALQNLITIVNPDEKFTITDDSPFNLRYMKLHGCAKEIKDNLETHQRLVITKKDFAQSSFKKGNFWKELERSCYHKSIIFLGFQAQNHSTIIETLEYAKQQISINTELPITFYAVLKDPSEDTMFDLRQLDITVLQGDIEDFISTIGVIELKPQISSYLKSVYTIPNAGISISENEIYEYNKQFYFFHEEFFKNASERCNALSSSERLDLWKSNPSNDFIFSGRCIERNQQKEILSKVFSLLNNFNENSTRKILIYGDRGSGKTVFIKKIAQFIFEHYGNPVLILNETSVYEESVNGEIKITSGWNYRQFDKFLSHFNINYKNPNSIPIIIADNVFSKLDQLEKLIENLNNHGKQSILIASCTSEEYTATFDNKLYSNDGSYEIVKLENTLDDVEINKLFNSVVNDKPEVIYLKERLLEKAKSDEYGKKDLLLILYMWFDEKYRKFEEIILEEADKITNSKFKKLFLSIAVFQRYNLKPPIEVCALGVGISAIEYNEYYEMPFFKALFSFEVISNNKYVITRHSVYTERVLKILMPTKQDQIEIMCQVLRKCSISDLDFVRSVFLTLCKKVIYRKPDIEILKAATEEVPELEKDYILNHQYASFLIRELDLAQDNDSQILIEDIIYYLDMALEESNDNPAIIHSKGNLEAKLYQLTGDEIHFDNAINEFNHVKAIRTIPDEYNYVTEIDLITYKIEKTKETNSQTKMLYLERAALIMEAITVVPKENHNIIIRRSKEYLVEFESLHTDEQALLIDLIDIGEASYTLMNYYAAHLLSSPKNKSWRKLKKIVQTYFAKDKSLEQIIAASIISKKAFILGSKKRFDLLRQYFDTVMQESNSLNAILKSEYLKTISIDAFVLKSFDLLKEITKAYTLTYRYNFAKYLSTEYVLKDRFYSIAENQEEENIRLFELYTNEHQIGVEAESFRRQINLSKSFNSTDYYNVELDIESGFFIKGVTYELERKDKIQTIGFNIKFDSDGFKVANVKSL